MQSHETGAIEGVRQGSVVVVQSVVLDALLSPPASATKKLISIPATPQKPVAYKLSTVVLAPITGSTTANLNVGSSNGATDLLTSDAKAAAGTANPATAPVVKVITAKLEIWVGFSSTGPTATGGKTAVIIELYELNTTKP